MNTEFCSLISYFLFGGEMPKISDWEGVYTLFKEHAVLPLAGTRDRLDGFDGIPENILNEWKKTVQDNISTFFCVRYAGKKLTQLLEKSGVTPIILKGAAAGKYYPEPAFRSYGDIDFLICGDKDEETVAELLMSEGFADKNRDDEFNRSRHIQLRRDDIEYELHKRFSLQLDDSDYMLDEMLKNAVPEKQDDFYCYDDVLNGIILLEHLKYHLADRGAGMRQVIDFMCFSEKIITEDFWNEKFLPVLNKLKLTKLAVHTIRMCELFFGTEAHSFTASADDELCRQLMDEICSSGNFGKNKDDFSTSVSRYINRGINFRQLQAGGMFNWKAAQKYKFLVPFAWIYQIFRLLGILISSRKKGKKLSDGINQKEKTDTLLLNLDLRKEQHDK